MSYVWVTPSGNVVESPGGGAYANIVITDTLTGAVLELIDVASLSGTVSGSGSGLTITNASPLANGTQGSPYSVTLAASGGTPPYILWQVTSGNLNPVGGGAPNPTPSPALSLKYTGVMQGSPLPNAETDSFTVMVTDSAAATATKTFSLTTSSVTPLVTWTFASGQFVTAVDPADTAQYLSFDSWAGNVGAVLIGWNSRYWKCIIPQAYSSGATYGYPNVTRGWYPALNNPSAPINGGTSTAPGVAACIQISALTKAKFRVIMRVPTDRTTAEYDLLCDNYFYNAATGSAYGGQQFQQSSQTVFSLNFFAGVLDTAQYWEIMIRNSSTSYATALAAASLTSSNYNNSATAGRVALDDKMFWYTLTNQSWAITPSSGLYNCLRLFPCPWNDTQHTGPKYLSVNYLNLINDLLASSLASQIPLTTSAYLGNFSAGFETDGAALYTITGITQANPMVVTINSTAASNPISVNNEIGFNGVGGMTQVNTIIGLVTAIGGSSGAWTFALNVNSTSFSAYTSGGKCTNSVYSILDFQTALGNASASDPDPVIYTVPEISQNIGRRQPVYTNVATINPASAANTANYNTWFRSNAAPSSGSPVNVYIDLTSATSTQKSNLLVNWTGENGNDGYLVNPSYDLLGTYTIQGNPSSFSGGVPPSSGWTTILTVTGNTRTSRTHLLGNCSAYNSFMISCTAGCANNATNDIGFHWDWSYGPQTSGVPDGWLFLGDSITNKTLQAWDCEEGGASDYIGQIISHYTGHIPICECGGNDGWTLAVGSSGATEAMINYVNGTYATWINDFPGRYIWVALGTNDGATGVTQSQFQTALTSLINIALAAGKTVVCPSIWYRVGDSGNPTVATAFSGYITNVLATFAGNSNVMAGPDLNTIGNNFQSVMFNSHDSIHPSPYGQAIYRALVADWIARVVYLGLPASSWQPDFSVGTGVGGD